MAEAELLTKLDTYLAAGVHIGTQQRDDSMRGFIYNIRPDGLSVFNLQFIDLRIKVAAKMIAQYPKEQVLVVSTRDSAKKAVDKFAEFTGCKSVADRFMPGSLTNPAYKEYMEPKVLVSTDPNLDTSAVREAMLNRMPIIGFCDTNTNIANIDLVVPGNNKGRKAVALMWYLLTREVLRARGELANDAEPQFTIDDFMAAQPTADEMKKRPEREDRKKPFRGGSKSNSKSKSRKKER